MRGPDDCRSAVTAALKTQQKKIPSAGRISPNVAVTLGLAGALAVSLSVLVFLGSGGRAPIVWTAACGIVTLVAALVLLYLELRKQTASFRLLAEVKERLDTAVEIAALGVWEWDVETGQVHCDKSWFALLGGERCERSQTAAEMAVSIHPADLSRLRAAAEAMLEGKTQDFDIEHRVQTRQGGCLWVRSRGLLVKCGRDGKARRILGVVADIGESVALREAQRQSRALMLSQAADLLQGFHSAVLHWGSVSMILPQITELAAKALHADRISLWYFGDEGNSIVCADSYDTASERHRSGSERDAATLPASMRKSYPDFIGNEFFVDELVASVPTAMYLPILRTEARIGVLEVERVGGVARWTTEERLYGLMISNLIMLLVERDAHREAQNALENRERQLSLITDSVPALIAYVSADERLEFHNRAYYQRFGQSGQPAIGRSLREILGDTLYRRTSRRVRLALKGTEVSFQITYRAWGGAMNTDLVRLVPQVSEGGEVLGFYALLIDITDQRRSEEALREALALAESAVRAKGAFLTTVSHELRTPLNAIIGFNTLMMEKDCSPEERGRYLSFARDAGQALLTQVNDLLDMARIEAGKMELELLDFDIAQLIETSVNVIRSQAQQKGLGVVTEFSPDLIRWVRGDPARLRQILLNLLNNALKFTEKGSIHVSARHVGDRMVEISVADTGVGIPPNRLGAIFEKFNQADVSISRRFGGTGLGLAICKNLAKLMGGAISVASTPGSGSIFRVTVPLYEASAPVATPAPLRGTRTGRILVVEDQEANAILANALLEGMGHRVTLAWNGVEALDKLAQDKFDVVLMDIEMPQMGGLEAAQRIRAMTNQNKNIPVIAMSASVYATDIASCRAAGMVEHIAKPIGREALIQTLERWLPERRMRPRTPAPPADDSPLGKLAGMVGHAAAVQVAKALETALVRRLGLFRAERLDLPAIKIEAHNLAGISNTLGFGELAETAHRVEDHIRRGEPVEELMPDLIAQCEAAERVLRTVLAEPVSG